MTEADTLYESAIPGLKLLARGKVRDIYEIDERHLLIITTDRLSAFDVVLPDPIPGKGAVLTAVSNFWFHRLDGLIPNHLADLPLERAIPDPTLASRLRSRSMVVRRLKPLPVEAVVRGYLIGSGWKDYSATGQVCGITLPKGLQLAEQLPEPIFTPSTKAEQGAHDENIGFERACELLGGPLAEQVRAISLRLYRDAADYARQRGIIIADTKFEFGLDESGALHWIDEALTPDSSRFWPADQYRAGSNPPSFDKQFVRDYLEGLDWNKRAPGPHLPPDIIARTAEKYREAEARLTRD
ncbi:MAG: phosphoribosylaminoimidazolesuccinocarboxamide synthase [Methylotetracoccus sp.]